MKLDYSVGTSRTYVIQKSSVQNISVGLVLGFPGFTPSSKVESNPQPSIQTIVYILYWLKWYILICMSVFNNTSIIKPLSGNFIRTASVCQNFLYWSIEAPLKPAFEDDADLFDICLKVLVSTPSFMSMFFKHADLAEEFTVL